MASLYGTLSGAQTYFSTRLHTDAWDLASPSDKSKALYSAARIIDTLNYKGRKSSVYTLLQSNANATDAQIRAADAAQEGEFPRDADTVAPASINMAAYEISLALLDGVNPDSELENLSVVQNTYGGVKAVYNRDQQPIEHLLNGVPSASAWRILKPFLRDSQQLKFSRVS